MPKTIEIFKRGTQVDSAGNKIHFDDATLEDAVSFANSGAFKVPGVIGHPKDNDPAWCWGANFAYSRETGKVTADIEETHPAFAEMVKRKMFDKISSALFGPNSPANPNPGKFTLRHIGFLGAAAPAVPGLAPISSSNFTAAEDTHEFSNWDDVQSASLMRSLRGWILAKFGQEDADRALPGYTVSNLQESAAVELATPGNSSYAAPAETAAPAEAVAEPVVEAAAPATNTTAPVSDYTEKEAALAAREAALAAREEELALNDFVSFCERAENSGRVPAELRGRAVAVFQALQSAATVDFAEEGAVSPANLFKDFIDGLPPAVNFGEVSAEEGAPTTEAVDFVAPAGATVDGAGLALMAKAHAYMKQHPGTDLLGAIKQIQSN